MVARDRLVVRKADPAVAARAVGPRAATPDLVLACPLICQQVVLPAGDRRLRELPERGSEAMMW